MKRSEAVEAIARTLALHDMLTFEEHKEALLSKADYVLVAVEQLGMLPPEKLMTFKDFLAIQSLTYAQAHGWEKE